MRNLYNWKYLCIRVEIATIFFCAWFCQGYVHWIRADCIFLFLDLSTMSPSFYVRISFDRSTPCSIRVDEQPEELLSFHLSSPRISFPFCRSYLVQMHRLTYCSFSSFFRNSRFFDRSRNTH